MTTPDYTTALVLRTLADLEARIAAGKTSGPGTASSIGAPGRATLVFGLGDLTPEQQVAMHRCWLARHAMPGEIRKEYQTDGCERE
jgi:hypothetical protein